MTLEELDDLLIDLLGNVSQSHFISVLPVFMTLYEFGFRIQELKDVHVWTFRPDGMIVAKTSKRGSPRLIDPNQCDQIIIESIKHGVNYLYRHNYRTYDNAFQKYSQVKSLSVGNKQLSTHAFRHNRIKHLAQSGMTDEEIRVHMGIRKVETVRGYIDSIIIKI